MTADATRWGSARWISVGVVSAAVMVSTVVMWRVVGQSSRMQYNDYWPMLDALLSSDGSIRWRGVVEFRNEHPIFLPKVAYVANVLAFDGDNRMLGRFVIAVVVAQVGLLLVLARRTDGMGRWGRVTVVAVAASLLLSRVGAWNFAKAMSGTAWLLANLFVLMALVAQQRDRRWLAVGLGLAASWSYGTGLAVWPALLVVGVVRWGHDWRKIWPTLVGTVAVMTWYLQWFSGYDRTPSVERGLVGRVGAVADRIGWTVVQGSAASWIGWLALAALLGAGLLAFRSRSTAIASAPWLGLATYGLVSCALVTNARQDWMLTGVGLSRYASLGAIVWISLVALVLLDLPSRPGYALAPAPLVLVGWLAGGAVVSDLAPSTRNHDLLAIAVHIDVADGGRVQGGLQDLPEITERLELAGHHPFSSAFDLDCGFLGEAAETSDALPSGVSGLARVVEPSRTRGGKTFSGRLETDIGEIDCVLVMDRDDVVVGAGIQWVEGGVTRIEALAPDQEGLTVHVRIGDDGELHPLPAEE